MKGGPILIVAAAVGCCAVALGSLLWQGNLPYKGYDEPTALVSIEAGQPARTAAVKLQEAKVIRSALVFRLLMRMRRSEAKLHAGEYEFTGSMTPSQVLDKLVRGDVVRHKLTIPEGLRLDEVAALVGASGLGDAQRFLKAAREVRLVADLDDEAQDLEGYLFPDTYFFARGTPEERIAEAMVERFRQELPAERQARIKELGFNVRQAVTLASLIEEEARAEDERPRISAVFHNRLRLQMLLQCDPTIVYALVRDGRYRGEIYRSDLAYRSPYNTYLHPGLPPGPICSPGARSIEAALYPASTRELYFVVSGPGRHEFSTNMQDHEEAVRRYRHELGLYRRRP